MKRILNREGEALEIFFFSEEKRRNDFLLNILIRSQTLSKIQKIKKTYRKLRMKACYEEKIK
jgi:hypothetical protein